jgi:diguanylate cyclase (GGDEF)-like protein
MPISGRYFFSLKYKAALCVAALSLLLSLLIYQISAGQLERLQTDNFQEKQQAIANDMEYLISESFNQLAVFAEQIATFKRNTNSEQQFESMLKKSWDDLELLTNLSGLELYVNANRQPVIKEGIDIGQSFSEMAQDAMNAGAVQRSIVCEQQCYLVTAIPVYSADVRSSVVLVKSIVDTVLKISALNDIELFLISKEQANSRSRVIEPWSKNLLLLTNGEKSLPILQEVANYVPYHELDERGKLHGVNNNIYQVWKTSQISTANGFIDILALDDVTSAMLIAKQHKSEVIIAVLLSVSSFALIVMILTIIPVKKIQKLVQQYPAIALHQFDKVRGQLPRPHKFFVDETDVLFKETNELVDKLETLHTAVESKKEELEYQALHDELTHLGNRNMFHYELEKTINNVKRYPRSWALVYVDLDNFKQVNDHLGHAAGDELLQTVAERLSSSLRTSDVVCRLGGDEFTIIVWELNKASDIDLLMKKLYESLRQPFNLEGHDIDVMMSAGVMMADESSQSTKHLMRCADMALYSAKDSGRNCYKIFDDSMSQNVERKFLIESEFENSIVNDEFKLVLQPQVHCIDGRLVGFEALVRWHHKNEEWIYPNHFIPVLEQSDRIVNLGRWVARTAIEQLAEISETLPNLRMSINLSAKQLYDEHFIDYIIQICDQNKIIYRQIELELTESVLIDDISFAKRWITNVQKQGFRVAIDDFGTGYSSLSYLSSLPFETVKLDRSFISHITDSKKDREIIEAMVYMVGKMGSDVVAEGVEELEQLNLLKKFGCKICQGFYIQKPTLLENLQDELDYYVDNNHWPTLNELASKITS